MILPPKQNPSHVKIFTSVVAVRGSHYIEVTRESRSPAEIRDSAYNGQIMTSQLTVSGSSTQPSNQ